jgi:arginase
MTNTINIVNERLAEFERVFNLFDANADGSLTRQEITELWRMCQALGLPDGPNLDINDLVYVAVRDTEEAEDHLIETHNILNITAEQMREIGPEAVAQRCLEKLADVDLIYVSFDVDSMDSAISMGTGTPVTGGILVEEARIFNETLVKDPRVCCWEICEINPVTRYPELYG